MNLSEFILARVAEDEAAARAAAESHGAYQWGDDAAEEAVEMAEGEGCSRFGIEHLRRWLPARVLAECDAKRRTVEHCEPDLIVVSPGDPYVLELLALPYADHPDYRSEWAP